MPSRSRTRHLLVLLVALTLAGVAARAADTKAVRVNINTATAVELEALPGIGPSVARRIVEHREKNGPFRRPADLLNVKGVGAKTYEALKDRLVVGDEKEG